MDSIDGEKKRTFIEHLISLNQEKQLVYAKNQLAYWEGKYLNPGDRLLSRFHKYQTFLNKHYQYVLKCETMFHKVYNSEIITSYVELDEPIPCDGIEGFALDYMQNKEEQQVITFHYRYKDDADENVDGEKSNQTCFRMRYPIVLVESDLLTCLDYNFSAIKTRTLIDDLFINVNMQKTWTELTKSHADNEMTIMPLPFVEQLLENKEDWVLLIDFVAELCIEYKLQKYGHLVFGLNTKGVC